jgi:malate dehydrogenase (quinone)
MVFSTDFNQLKEWMPLVMEGRSETDRVAATSMTIGTDVNFGELTRNIYLFGQFRRCNDAF